MNLLLLDPGERALDARDPRAQHIRKVLRLGPGGTLRAGELGGDLGTARILDLESDRVTLEFRAEAPPPPLPPVDLLLGHPRPIVLKRMLRDLTAIGVGRIIVVSTDLGEKSYRESNLWEDTLTPMREGASQGGTTRLPALLRSWTLGRGIDELTAPSGRRVVLHAESDPTIPPRELIPAERRADRHILNVLARLESGPLALAVGSERGWSEREVRQLLDAGFEPCTLGARILRTETAATVALWAAVSCYHSRREDGGTAD